MNSRQWRAPRRGPPVIVSVLDDLTRMLRFELRQLREHDIARYIARRAGINRIRLGLVSVELTIRAGRGQIGQPRSAAPGCQPAFAPGSQIHLY